MCTRSPSAPKPPPVAPAAPTAAPAPGGARADARKRGARKGGTLLTGPRGLTEPATTQPKTLLGG